MSVRLGAMEFDAREPERLAGFWAEMLGRDLAPDGRTAAASTPANFDIQFTHSDVPKQHLDRMHIDIRTHSLDDQLGLVARALDLGGSHLDVGQRGDEGHVVLADPEGNEFCVIEPDNAFLADTARVGALSGDGLPATGYFWSAALGWPLVWDQDEETAIQSPEGGTKLTWGGPPVELKHGRNRLRFRLEVDGALGVEIDRLRSLGATLLLERPDESAFELADPDDNEFLLTGSNRPASPG